MDYLSKKQAKDFVEKRKKWDDDFEAHKIQNQKTIDDLMESRKSIAHEDNAKLKQRLKDIATAEEELSVEMMKLKVAKDEVDAEFNEIREFLLSIFVIIYPEKK